MTEVIFIISALFIAAGIILSIVSPLVRNTEQSVDIEKTSFDLAVFRDQLEEINRDRDVGRLPDAEAAAAKAEIERRMLKAIDTQSGDLVSATKHGQGLINGLAFPIALGLVAVLASVGLYFNLGNIGLDDAPLSKRGDIQIASSSGNLGNGEAGDEGRAIIARLAKRLDANPNDLQGWITLGRTQRSLGDYKSAVLAFEQAIKVAGPRKSAELLSDYGETLVFEAFGTVSPRAVEMFQEALARDPTDIKSRYYIAASRSQLGDYRGAIALWRGLTADAPPDAPWIDTVKEQISSAALKGGIMPMSVVPERRVLIADGLSGAIAGDIRPDQKTVNSVQQMDKGDQQAFIRSMVQRLADRLKENPEDVDGWLRLGRAYRVIGERQEAVQAFNQAKRELERLLGGLAISPSSREAIETKLKAVEALIKG